MKLCIPSHLPDTALVGAVKYFARGERDASAQLVAHLAEFDARRLYSAAGFSSMFKYCCVVLRMSEDVAYNRIETARAAHRFPVILSSLANGTLNVTTVRLLARRLTHENHAPLLAAASGRSKREVEELVAQHYPQPDVPSAVRKLPRPPETVAAALTPDAKAAPLAPTESGPPVLFAPPPAMRPARPRPSVAPLADDRYLVKMTVSHATQEKLRLAQDLLSHANPTRDLAEVLDRALTLLIDDLKRKKFAATQKPRRSPGVKLGSRGVPAAVKREAAERDHEQCGFVGTDGHRCGERAFVEFHHVDAVAGGGQAKPGWIELRCRTHNAYEAELYFGGTMNLRTVQHGPDRARSVSASAASSPSRPSTPVTRGRERDAVGSAGAPTG